MNWYELVNSQSLDTYEHIVEDDNHSGNKCIVCHMVATSL